MSESDDPYRSPGGWAKDLNEDLDVRSPEEWLMEARMKRDELSGLDREIGTLEREVATLSGRLKGLKVKREDVRKEGEHAFSQIGETLKKGR